MKLILPSGFKPSGMWKHRGKAFKEGVQKKTAWGHAEMQKTEPRVHPGKKFGATVGGWIDDLVQTRKAIILCWQCQPKFDHAKYNYYKDRRFPHVVGKCDGCKTIMNYDTKLYIHESLLGDPDGNSKAGHSWTPM